MIANRSDLLRFLMDDDKNNNFSKKCFNRNRKFIRILRKTEYHTNTKHFLRGIFYKFIFRRLSNRYLISIPLNCFDSGISIAHLACIHINGTAKIGKNCRIHEMVTIGATNGEKESPQIGNNVFIGSGAKIIGNITIADDVAIGAGAVVVKDITEPGTTWAGVPAKKISNNGSKSFIPCLSKNN